MARLPTNTGKRLLGKIVAGDVYLALDRADVVGSARVDSLWPEQCPLLSCLYIEPAYRKMALSDQLRQFVYQSLKAEGSTSLLRSACTERPHMVSRLRAEGLQEAGRLKFLNGVEEIFFWHHL